jgi:hypothetical protein
MRRAAVGVGQHAVRQLGQAHPRILGTVTGPPIQIEALAREWWPQRDKLASAGNDFFAWILRAHPEYREVEVVEVKGPVGLGAHT